jgi:hypothetical protein
VINRDGLEIIARGSECNRLSALVNGMTSSVALLVLSTRYWLVMPKPTAFEQSARVPCSDIVLYLTNITQTSSPEIFRTMS